MTTAAALGLEGTLLVQLNLNHAALEVASRRAVITHRYRPLLAFLESRPWLRLALAVSGHTLERIARLDPEWIPRLRALLEAGRIEFVGSGDTQLIGPLVPAAVNRWNQALGRETYLRLLERAPRVALVNEMAWSQGLVDAYLDAGYEALILAWNDPCRPNSAGGGRTRSVWTQSPTGRRIRVLLGDARLAQGLQPALAGAEEPERYVEGVLAQAAPPAKRSPSDKGREPGRHVLLCADEAEAFACQPRAGASERAAADALTDSPTDFPTGTDGVADANTDDWGALGEVCDALHAHGLAFTTPEILLADACFAPEATLELCSAANPIPVMEGPGRNVTRWALSGWDGVGVNARCFARTKELESVGGTAHDWQLLCRAWGSDLRVHLTEKRWRRFARSLPIPRGHQPSETAFVEAPLRSCLIERAGKRLALGTEGVRVVLNLRRGLAIDALTLSHAGPQALLGTLPFGALADWGADAYSGQAVLEVPGQKRITDLEPVEPHVERLTHCIRVSAVVPTALGPLAKEVRLYAHRLEIRYGFAAWGTRPRGTLRAGNLTLLDGALGEKLWVSCANGGPRERLALLEDCDHGRGSSPATSACAALGATDGWVSLDDGRQGVEVSWPQEEAAALPLLTHRRVGSKRFVRLAFSLAEFDETHRPGAPLHDLRLSIRAYRKRR